jgi:hypothetical protein
MIQPEFKPLVDILSGKIFSIPEYQRHYSWEKEQRKDLFEDISKLSKATKTNEDRMHFMSTIVCLKTHEKQQVGSNSFSTYEVVDGQQRLTTLIILLKAIAKKLNSEGKFEEEKELNKILVKDDGRLIILQNNHDNIGLLRNYLVDGKIPDKNNIKTTADKNISQAIKDCEKFVADVAIETIPLLSLVKNNLYFVFQSLEDKGAVYTTFEVLNSRGLEVDWLDKCKSMLMGLLYEYSSNKEVFEQHLDSLHKYWSQIYREIGLQSISGQEIIRFAATFKEESEAGRPLSAESALEFFRDSATKSGEANDVIKSVEKYTMWLEQVTSALSQLYKDKRRNTVTEITQARLMAVSIMLREGLTDDERNRLLKQWENTTFKIYGLLDKDSRVKVGDYVRVSKKIFKDRSVSVNELIKEIANIGREYPISKAADELERKDCYTNWQNELKYFFYRYEEYLSKKNQEQIDEKAWERIWEKNLNETIEHILPKDISKECWSSLYRESEHEELVNKIGNLCLLSQELNSEAKNDCFEKKLDIYRRTSLLATKAIIKNPDGTERASWTPEDIRKRTQELISFAKEEWKDLQ